MGPAVEALGGGGVVGSGLGIVIDRVNGEPGVALGMTGGVLRNGPVRAG
jgi:hypothetical protein